MERVKTLKGKEKKIRKELEERVLEGLSQGGRA